MDIFIANETFYKISFHSGAFQGEKSTVREGEWIPRLMWNLNVKRKPLNEHDVEAAAPS